MSAYPPSLTEKVKGRALSSEQATRQGTGAHLSSNILLWSDVFLIYTLYLSHHNLLGTKLLECVELMQFIN